MLALLSSTRSHPACVCRGPLSCWGTCPALVLPRAIPTCPVRACEHATKHSHFTDRGDKQKHVSSQKLVTRSGSSGSHSKPDLPGAGWWGHRDTIG